MRRVQNLLKFTLIFALFVPVLLGLSGAAGNTAQAATAAATGAATSAATVSAGIASSVSLCMAPTPTPGGTQAPTEAATVAATTAATTAATAKATTAATAKATKEVTPTKTKVPPTATPIPKGKKPATAGLVLINSASVVRANGLKCPGVNSVTAGGPAAVAGIKKGDYVLGFDDDELKDSADFFAHVAKHVSGDTVTLTIQRGDKAQVVQVVLGLNQFAK
jgi:predicted metalloprotease with PDZ domain